MGTLLGGGYGHDNTWENGDERGLQGQGIYKNHGHVRLRNKSAEVGRFLKGHVDDIYVFMSNTQYNQMHCFAAKHHEGGPMFNSFIAES